jgi:hypothetical protein
VEVALAVLLQRLDERVEAAALLVDLDDVARRDAL